MKNRNLIILFILIIVWSLFFAVYKYFIWGIFKTEIITLQYISGCISIGPIGAYIVGGLLYEIFREKIYHFFITFSSILIILSIYFIKLPGVLFIGGITLFIGFFYGFWNVLKNVLISTEIQNSGYSDTFINGLSNIFFITSIIFGSIAGGIIAEKLNIIGVFVIIFLLFIGLFAGLFFNYEIKIDLKGLKEKAKYYKETYLLDFVFVIKKYHLIMILITLIIATATIISQKAIEFNVQILGREQSTSTFLLLYSAVGSIIGNILSMRIKKDRWIYFTIFNTTFAISIFLFPVFIKNFLHTSILAFVRGIFFGVSFNLIESYFLKKLADDDKKSYGSAIYGVITSLIIAFLMFFIDIFEKQTNFTGVYIFLGIIILISAATMFLKRQEFNN